MPIVFDSDDFGANHIMSDQCQSHDCRDQLDKLHYHNPNFKATLFAIPAEITYELAEWCKSNKQWIELAVHGVTHSSNYECAEMSYEEFDSKIDPLLGMIEDYFAKGFKAPGWQISDGVYQWLQKNGWWIADQEYNTEKRRPKELPAYVNDNGRFYTPSSDDTFTGIHTHTWDCVGNGIYELEDQLKQQMNNENEFLFISELLS